MLRESARGGAIALGTAVPNQIPRHQASIPRPPDAKVRASAGRIVDILQQLVLSRPDMILPLESVVRNFLTQHHIGIVTQDGEPAGLLEPSAGGTPTRERRAKPGDKRKR